MQLLYEKNALLLVPVLLCSCEHSAALGTVEGTNMGFLHFVLPGYGDTLGTRETQISQYPWGRDWASINKEKKAGSAEKMAPFFKNPHFSSRLVF